MYSRVTLTGNHPTSVDIAEQYDVSVKSMILYYSKVNPGFSTQFRFFTDDEVENEREDRLEETDTALALTLLASIEASFRVDYLRRCYRRRKDSLSRNFRELYKRKRRRVSLEDDLLEAWKRHAPVPSSLVGDIKGAFKYRHWLAHGRYWVQKLGRRYDFSNIYELACTVEKVFPFEAP